MISSRRRAGDGVAVGADVRRRRLRQALTIRQVERRLLALFAEGRIDGTVHTCLGQEWTGVALAEVLRSGDFILSNHRCHGHFLAWTDDVEGLIAEVTGRRTGVCGGRGGSQHLAAPGFLSNGIIGGMAPVAAGLALAAKRRAAGNVVALFLGDGAMAQGVVFEALNAAAVFRVPLLVICEVNGIAQSTVVAEVQAGTPADRARAFGIDTFEVDGRNLDALFGAAARAVELVRRHEGPALLAVSTTRLGPHSKGDDTRPADEIERLRRADPLTMILAEAEAETLALIAAVDARIERAVAAALAAPAATEPEPSSPPSLPPNAPAIARPGQSSGDPRQIEAVRNGLGDALANDPRVILLGEDIAGDYGGAFKATAGLAARFPGRTLNTAISEAGLVGLGTGLALAGFRPIVEIMFGDFLGLAFDQLLNHAAKFGHLGDGQIKVPLIVRTPMGGRRGYGPTHSQSIEKHFVGVPGLTVAAIHHRTDARAFLARLTAAVESPHLLIENKTAYGRRLTEGRLDGFDYLENDDIFPTLTIRPALPPDLTIFCYGGALIEVEAAVGQLFDQDEIVCEVICPTLLHPLDTTGLRRSALRSGRVLSVEEGQGSAGIGAEAVAQLLETGASGGTASLIQRISAHPSAIAAAVGVEARQLPSAATIIEAARRLMGKGKE